jgi:hypothetical protein
MREPTLAVWNSSATASGVTIRADAGCPIPVAVTSSVSV